MIVVDTNVLVSYLIPGTMTRAAEGVRTRDSLWIAPRLLRSELLNALSKYVTIAGTMDRDRALRAFRRAMGLVSLNEEEPEALDVLNICVQVGITAYDAEFVVLALRENVRLVTLDKAILRAFPGQAINMHDFAAGL